MFKKSFRALLRTAPLVFSAVAALGQAPVNDDPPGATLLPGPGVYPGPFNVGYDNTAATNSAGFLSNCVGIANFNRDVFFYLVPSATGPLDVSTCTPGGWTPGTLNDTVVAVYADTGGLPGALLGCNDDACGFRSSLTFPATAGSGVFVRVGAFVATGGTFYLSIGSYLPGDACSSSIPAAVNGTTPFNASGNAFAEAVAPSCGGGADPFDVWFSFLAPVSGVAVATLCPTSQFVAGGTATPADTALSAWTGACGALVQVSCATSSPTCGAGPAETSFSVTAGTTYYVRVVAEGGGPAVGVLAMATNAGPCAPPANDAPGAAPWVTANTQEPATYDNSCANGDLPPAGYQPPPPNPPPMPNRDVWVCFDPDGDVCYRLTSLALFETEIEVFVTQTGSSGTTYERESGTSGDDSAHGSANGLFVTTTTFCFCGDKKYWIALASKNLSGGLITLAMSTCNSLKFTSDAGTVTLSSIGDGSTGGRAGDSVRMFFTTDGGNYPDGWFFGIDIGLFELFQQLNLGPVTPLLDGTLDADKTHTHFTLNTLASAISGLTFYVTSVFYDPISGQVAGEICPAKITFP